MQLDNFKLHNYHSKCLIGHLQLLFSTLISQLFSNSKKKYNFYICNINFRSNFISICIYHRCICILTTNVALIQIQRQKIKKFMKKKEIEKTMKIINGKNKIKQIIHIFLHTIFSYQNHDSWSYLTNTLAPTTDRI